MSVAKKLLSGSGAVAEAVNIEDVMNVHIYNGSNTTTLRTNYIDLATTGGMTWIHNNRQAADHVIFDSERTNGGRYLLHPNLTDAVQDEGGTVWTPQSNGFNINGDGSTGIYNQSGNVFNSYTFAKKEGFFDIVTYTGDGTTNRQISHNLGAEIGMLLVKRTDATSNWACVMYNGSSFSCLQWNTNAAEMFTSSTSYYTSTMFEPYNVFQQFTDVPNNDRMNVSGASYVAYLWARHNSDGTFGPDGDLDVIKVGSYTGNGNDNGPELNFGFDPQFYMFKKRNGTGSWFVYDQNRGITMDGHNSPFFNVDSDQPDQSSDRFWPTGRGIKIADANDTWNQSGGTYIYMAIRRGPTALAEAGTDVMTIQSSTSASTAYFSGTDSKSWAFVSPDDTLFFKQTNGTESDYAWPVATRQGGVDNVTSWTTTTTTTTPTVFFPLGNARITSGSKIGHYPGTTTNTGGNPKAMVGIAYGNPNDNTITAFHFRRSPEFLDIVSYKATGSYPYTIYHSLRKTPEMIWVKSMSNAENWAVYHSAMGNTKQGTINGSGSAFGTEDTASSNGGVWGTIHSSLITVGNNGRTGATNNTYVAWLWASQDGVSKVGSYTGTGGDITVDCGFYTGARFIMIKEANGSGDWYVFNSVNGIVAGGDGYLLMNSSQALVSTADLIDPDNSGFIVTSTGGTTINNSGSLYLFWAVA